LWAEELARARYRVLGINISEAMIEIARRRVSDAEFRVGSLFEAEIPPCVAVTSLGKVLNYLFDPNNDGQRLVGLFRRVYSALAPGGVFVFDVAEPGQVARGTATRGFSEGEDWVVVLEKEEDAERRMLIRRITSFRRGRGTLPARRRNTPSAAVRIVGDRERTASGGFPRSNDARLRSIPSAEGPRGVRRTQAGVR
jgi:SAM-dependent methyltransferase